MNGLLIRQTKFTSSRKAAYKNFYIKQKKIYIPSLCETHVILQFYLKMKTEKPKKKDNVTLLFCLGN